MIDLVSGVTARYGRAGHADEALVALALGLLLVFRQRQLGRFEFYGEARADSLSGREALHARQVGAVSAYCTGRCRAPDDNEISGVGEMPGQIQRHIGTPNDDAGSDLSDEDMDVDAVLLQFL